MRFLFHLLALVKGVSTFNYDATCYTVKQYAHPRAGKLAQDSMQKPFNIE